MTPEVHEIHLPCRLSSVKVGRHFVRDVLTGAALDELTDNAQLGTSELVANAVRHAGTDLLLTVVLDDLVTVSIEDHDPELRRPMAATPDHLSESGRGLHIVAAVSQDWGLRSIPGGKVLWFTLAFPRASSPDAHVVDMGHSRMRRGGTVSPERRAHHGAGADQATTTG